MAKKPKDKKEPWEFPRPRPTIALPPEKKDLPSKPVVPLMAKPPLDLDLLGDDDIERVLKAIIFFDPRRVLDSEGHGLPLNMLDDATALALAGFEVEQLFQGGGAARINIGVLKKFRLTDRTRAAETLWKKQGKLRSVPDDVPAGETAKDLDTARKDVKALVSRLYKPD